MLLIRRFLTLFHTLAVQDISLVCDLRNTARHQLNRLVVNLKDALLARNRRLHSFAVFTRWNDLWHTMIYRSGCIILYRLRMRNLNCLLLLYLIPHLNLFHFVPASNTRVSIGLLLSIINTVLFLSRPRVSLAINLALVLLNQTPFTLSTLCFVFVV